MKKPKKLPPLSEVQMEIMNVLWDRKEATLGDIWSELAEKRPVAKNTVQTLLTRLVDKGWLRARLEGKAYRYSPAVPKEGTVKAALRRLMESAFQGSASELMTALLDDQILTRDEANRIRALIEEAEMREGGKL